MAESARKGAARMSDIPAAVLRDLNAGRMETRTLVEWLAIDIVKLARAVVKELPLDGDRGAALVAEARQLAGAGVQQRSRGMGAAVHRIVTDAGRDGHEAFEVLASHTSDMVRAWAAYAVAADGSLSLRDRLAAVRRFAADLNMSVRESAWDAWRPHFAREQAAGFKLLRAWATDADAGIRRCAVEGTRPRGVWTNHIEALKKDPEPGLAVLEPVRSDPSDYVRRAVGNWLNDASKSRPDWVLKLCRRWERESPTPETAWITRHATRTLRKAGG